MLSTASFHFKNLFICPSIASLIWTKSTAYSNSLTPSQSNSETTSTTTAKKDDSTDPWCISTLTSNSFDKSESTLTHVFAPSYGLITELTKTSGNPSFLIVHSNAFLSSPSRDIYWTTKHIQLFSFSMILFLQPSYDKHCINCSSLMHKAKLHFINSHYSMKPFHNILSTTFIPYSRSFIALWQVIFLKTTFPEKIGTTILRAHSTGIPNQSRTLTYFSLHLSSYSQRAAISSNATAFIALSFILLSTILTHCLCASFFHDTASFTSLCHHHVSPLLTLHEPHQIHQNAYQYVHESQIGT